MTVHNKEFYAKLSESQKQKKKEYMKPYMKIYYQKNKKKIDEYIKVWQKKHSKQKSDKNKLYLQKKRKKAEELLGGKCERCGEKEKLQFHHIYYIKSYQANIQNEVVKHPEQFELLCQQCHVLTGIAKHSPHKIELIYKKLQMVII